MLSVLLIVLAWAGPASGIETRDVAGSGGNWQEGRAVVDAPIDEVRGWLLDFDGWPRLFSDVTSARTLSRAGGDQAQVRFRSRIIGRELTINLRWNDRDIVYRGAGKNVDVQGKILLRPVDRQRTEVIMQSTAEVHGLSGAFATPGLKRERAFKKLRADLGALEKLAGAHM